MVFSIFLIIHKHKKVYYPFENFTMSLQVATSTENTQDGKGFGRRRTQDIKRAANTQAH